MEDLEVELGGCAGLWEVPDFPGTVKGLCAARHSATSSNSSAGGDHSSRFGCSFPKAPRDPLHPWVPPSSTPLSRIFYFILIFSYD
ncbi:hypothetical protein ILYODFUR_021342 [Ilyodon furcidens]|uniref:Uncharacterized protein n=1 Tax=Ilyodon furcidens TaxID=33524 RepID=A0ABV0T9W1_9TELE